MHMSKITGRRVTVRLRVRVAGDQKRQFLTKTWQKKHEILFWPKFL